METLALPQLATAKSGLPSPLKSATAIDQGFTPTMKGLPGAGVNPPAPFPSITHTLPSSLVVAKSRKPSPLKSAVTIVLANPPTATGLPGAGLSACEQAPDVATKSQNPSQAGTENMVIQTADY